MDWLNGENISILLFFIGFYGLVARRNIFKSIMAIGIMQVAAILYFIAAGYKADSMPPIGENLSGRPVADALPQALMITDIVIGIGITAVTLTLMIHLYHRYGTSNWLKARQKRIE